MKIKGKIVKKRPYTDAEIRNVNCITFLEIDDGLVVNGDTVKILPILSHEQMIPQKVGEVIEVDGDMIYKQIITSSGKRSMSAIPTLSAKRLIMN